MRNVFYFSKKVRLFSQNDVLFLFYFLINLAGTTGFYFVVFVDCLGFFAKTVISLAVSEYCKLIIHLQTVCWRRTCCV